MIRRLVLACSLLLASRSSSPAAAAGPAAARITPNLVDHLDRPLRYRPDGADFVIENGTEFFNRALYGGNTAFRVDGGDKPEFVLYLPGRGGNLRFALRTPAGAKWLHEAAQIETRYRPGQLLYTVRDPLLGANRALHLSLLARADTEGAIIRAELVNGVPASALGTGRHAATDGQDARATQPVPDPAPDSRASLELVWAYGGVNGERGKRDGDIGTEAVPISQWFQLQPEFCRGNEITLTPEGFTLDAKPATIAGVAPAGAQLAIGDAANWNDLPALLASGCGAGSPDPAARSSATGAPPAALRGGNALATSIDQNAARTSRLQPIPAPLKAPRFPVVVGRCALVPGRFFFLSLERVGRDPRASADLDTYRAVTAARSDVGRGLPTPPPAASWHGQPARAGDEQRGQTDRATDSRPAANLASSDRRGQETPPNSAAGGTPRRDAALTPEDPETPPDKPQRGTGVSPVGPVSAVDLARCWRDAERHFRELRHRVRVDTPDPFLNAAVGALNIAADAAWDEPQQAIMHGAIAWRTKLLGWRGPYALDALGWHDRFQRNFTYWAGRQNVDSIPATLPSADENANLARNEAGLHSNGDLSNSHYDMNLVAIDALFRHLQWTGDLAFAEKMWPVIERHLAWERRLFRREFGPEHLPLYEAYAAIWASDDLQYHGGGTAHASAYNYYHNQQAARLARLLGRDPAPYAHEAELIARAMRTHLWLPREGTFAEFKDLLGLQRVHPSAAVWTFYHTMDAGLPTPQEAWQMTRRVDTQIPHLPVRGPGVPGGLHVVSTTNWMPYTWSINNVVLPEIVHTALGFWQAGRPEEAWTLTRSALLASMYLGIAPGNVGSMSYLDVYRRESQRDFADSSGVLSRALVEGLFGLKPDLLAGELRVEPGFPSGWDHAAINHPDVALRFDRRDDSDHYVITQHFAKPQALRLVLPAPRDRVGSLAVNGDPASWQVVEDAVGAPRIVITSPAGFRHEVLITWAGEPIAQAGGTGVWPVDDDPHRCHQGEIQATTRAGCPCHDERAASSTPRRFTRTEQGQLRWWQPVDTDSLSGGPAHERRDEAPSRAPFPPPAAPAPGDIHGCTLTPLPPGARVDCVELTPYFNDRVTQIFRNEYRSPRSPGVSLAIPKQGIGGWAGSVNATAEIDDSGLRRAADRNRGRIFLPNGAPLATPGLGRGPDSVSAEALGEGRIPPVQAAASDHGQDTRATAEPAAAPPNNIVFTSQWDDYPESATVPLAGRARRVLLLLAGSTNPMQSRIDNGEIVVAYTDGTITRLALANPINWWPIEQDYFIDDFQFRRPEPLPVRVDLKTGEARVLTFPGFKGRGGRIPGGAATVLELPLDPARDLQSLTVRTLSNEVVVGLMAATLVR